MNNKLLFEKIKLIGLNQSNKIKHLQDNLKSNLKKIEIQNYLKNTNTLISQGINLKQLLQRTQDYLEKRIEGEKLEVVLKQSNSWAKIICWSLVGGTTFGIGWLAIAKTEEIVIVTGKIEPTEGVVEIKIPSTSVASKILIEEGQQVKKGEILVEFDSEASKAKDLSLQKNKAINSEILESLELLVEQGAVAKVQYLQQKAKLADLESEISRNNVVMKYQTITAPVEGTIFDLKPKKPGYVADPSTPILKIVPYGKLQANIEIESKNIGFVNVGKSADISIDSYPASDFGVINGKVKSISSDALPPDPRLNKGFRFPAIIELNNQYLQLKNKKKLPLQVGMSLSANIKLRKVSYLQLLLNTFQEKADSLRTLQ
jgi:hemolysin D